MTSVDLDGAQYLDILIVEDISSQVTGMVQAISMHGSNAAIDGSGLEARESLSTERWGAALFDLSIPLTTGEQASPHVGLTLIEDLRAGQLGDLNARIPFGILSNQGPVAESATWFGEEDFLGVFTKLGDVRDLLGVLSRRALISPEMTGLELTKVVRRRVKILVHRSESDGVVLASIPSWGDEKFELSTRGLHPRLRRELRTRAPAFVYGYANVAATHAAELDPRELHDVVQLVEDLEFRPLSP